MTTGLPEGWATIRVGDYFHSWGGMTPSTSNASYWDGNVPWVSSKDIKAWRIAGGEELITRKALQETRLRLCPVGSVLIVVRSGILAHTLPIAVADAPVSINQDLKAFYCPDSDMNEWLALALRSLAPEILSNNRKDGTTVQSVRYEELCDLMIQVPPSHEQQRIAARLGNLLEKVGSTRERLSRDPEILKRFRQAVLAAACSGRLTEDWRAENSNVEPLVPLQEPIKIIRRPKRRAGRLWGAGVVPELTDAEKESLPELWIWTKVRDLGEHPEDTVQVGPMSMRSKDFDASGVPVLNVGCVQWGHFDESKLDYMPPAIAAGFERYRIAKGDVLFTRSGTVGRCAVAKDQQHAYLMTFHLLRVRPSAQKCLPEYLQMVFQGARNIRRQTEEAAIGSTRAGFNTNLLADLDVPLPPLPEQREIVRIVSELFQFADALDERINAAAGRADKLTQSILAKAFRGELVPTEAELARREGREYEPASVLLERIKKERNSGTPSKATRHRMRLNGKLASAKGKA